VQAAPPGRRSSREDRPLDRRLDRRALRDRRISDERGPGRHSRQHVFELTDPALAQEPRLRVVDPAEDLAAEGVDQGDDRLRRPLRRVREHVESRDSDTRLAARECQPLHRAEADAKASEEPGPVVTAKRSIAPASIA
jgi:hypothetical protein